MGGGWDGPDRSATPRCPPRLTASVTRTVTDSRDRFRRNRQVRLDSTGSTAPARRDGSSTSKPTTGRPLRAEQAGSGCYSQPFRLNARCKPTQIDKVQPTISG